MFAVVNVAVAECVVVAEFDGMADVEPVQVVICWHFM